jgi:hypothetical protein
MRNIEQGAAAAQALTLLRASATPWETTGAVDILTLYATTFIADP